MDLDYIRVIDSFVETVNTPILVIDNRSYVILSNKAAVDLLGNDFKDRHFYVAIRQPAIAGSCTYCTRSRLRARLGKLKTFIDLSSERQICIFYN
jgi:hypothetical protein